MHLQVGQDDFAAGSKVVFQQLQCVMIVMTAARVMPVTCKTYSSFCRPYDSSLLYALLGQCQKAGRGHHWGVNSNQNLQEKRSSRKAGLARASGFFRTYNVLDIAQEQKAISDWQDSGSTTSTQTSLSGNEVTGPSVCPCERVTDSRTNSPRNATASHVQ